MGDLLQKITELKADGRLIEHREQKRALPQFDDWVDQFCHNSGQGGITDNTPAHRRNCRPGKKNKP